MYHDKDVGFSFRLHFALSYREIVLLDSDSSFPVQDDLKERKDIVSSFLPEVILALKEVRSIETVTLRLCRNHY